MRSPKAIAHRIFSLPSSDEVKEDVLVAKLSLYQERIQQLEQDKADLVLAFHTSISNLKDEISLLRQDKWEMLGMLERASLSPNMDMGTKQDIKALIARMEGKG